MRRTKQFFDGLDLTDDAAWERESPVALFLLRLLCLYNSAQEGIESLLENGASVERECQLIMDSECRDSLFICLNTKYQ